MNEIRVASIAGTGAAINIPLGFIPDSFRIVNETDGDAIWEWYRGMTDGHAIKATTSVAKITANGVSEYKPDDVNESMGVTIGTDISISGKTLYYVAQRSGPGHQGDGQP